MGRQAEVVTMLTRKSAALDDDGSSWTDDYGITESRDPTALAFGGRERLASK